MDEILPESCRTGRARWRFPFANQRTGCEKQLMQICSRAVERERGSVTIETTIDASTTNAAAASFRNL
jgi:hypothetical protein